MDRSLLREEDSSSDVEDDGRTSRAVADQRSGRNKLDDLFSADDEFDDEDEDMELPPAAAPVLAAAAANSSAPSGGAPTTAAPPSASTSSFTRTSRDELLHVVEFDNFPPPPATPMLAHLYDVLCDFAVAIEEEKVSEVADELFERWLFYPEGKLTPHVAYALYGEDMYSIITDMTTLDKKQQTWVTHALQVVNRLCSVSQLRKDDKDSKVLMQFKRVLESIDCMHSMIITHQRSLIVLNPSSSLGPAILHRWELVMENSMADASSYQKFLLHVLKCAHDKNLRKYNGRLYKQKVITGEDGTAFMTHAWEVYADIDEFIYESVSKEKNVEMWLNMTSAKGNVAEAVKHLKSSVDYELPLLVPDRHVFAFQNCLYHAPRNKVYIYSDPDCSIPSSMVAAKYFDIPFPVEYSTFQNGHRRYNWRDIPTPKLDGILLHQKIPTEPFTPKKKVYSRMPDGSTRVTKVDDEQAPKLSVLDWFYVFIGRMIYEINEYDSWQVLLFIKGIAGSGKSTLGKIVSFLYDANDVGVLSNNTEKKFGLAPLIDKLIYICYEVKNDFQLDQGEFQCMVSGEQMSIPVKFENAQSVNWKTHGMFMGNEVASWCDNSGSMSRRIVLALFNEAVTDGNPKLFEELQAEMAHIVIKSNRAYMEASHYFGQRDIWNVLPPYFENNRRKLRSETHGLAYFFESNREEDSTYLSWGAEKYMTLEDLKTDMRSFLQSENAFRSQIQLFKPDYYQWVIDAYGLKISKERRLYNGQDKPQTFVIGVTSKRKPHPPLEGGAGLGGSGGSGETGSSSVEQ